MTESDREVRTIWDVLTGLSGARVAFPDRPSHALVILGNGWAVVVTVSPSARCSTGSQQMRFAGDVQIDVLGRYGSPEGWFDLAADCEVSIMRDDGTWYRCEMSAPWPPVKMQSRGYVDPEQLLDLIERVDRQPGGCLCPACHP
jgi:hypothetical protein